VSLSDQRRDIARSHARADGAQSGWVKSKVSQNPRVGLSSACARDGTMEAEVDGKERIEWRRLHQQKRTALALWSSGRPDQINNLYSLLYSFSRSGRRKSGPVVALPSGDLVGSGLGLFALVATPTRPFRLSRCACASGPGHRVACSRQAHAVAPSLSHRVLAAVD
jgi:hypothetical protein